MTDDQLIITACNNWLKSHNRADYLTLAYESIEDLLVVLKTQKMDINVMRDTMQSMMEGQCIIAGNRQPKIVRCIDCAHGEPNDCGEVICNLIIGDDAFHPETWFCADGERRTDDV